MPIFRRTYRSFDGGVRRRFRWTIVMEQELRALIKAKPFLLLCLVAGLHCLLRIGQIMAFDVIMQDSNNQLTPFLLKMDALTVDTETFFDFVRIQSPLLFIACLYAGAGMIAGDFRNNLMEVYFSKPIRWYDYALGKFFALVVIGLCLTAVPGALLVVTHNLLAPSVENLQESWWWPISIFFFSLVVIIPTALCILASSALMRSQNFAAVAVFMVLVAHTALTGILVTTLHRPKLMLLSFPHSLNRIGESLFLHTTFSRGTDLTTPIIYFSVVCLVSGWVVFRRIRQAEVAS